MNFAALQQFVSKNVDWFRGQSHESTESLARYEINLGRSFPHSIKWLLTTHGYWHATGISNLEDSVQLTLDCRKSISLPRRYIILNDHGDGGVILLDTCSVANDGEMRIHNIEASGLHCLDGREIEPDIVYESFGDYLVDVLKSQRGIIAPEDVAYDPHAYGD